MVRLLHARQGDEVNTTAQNGATALMVASHQGHVEVVRLLLAHQDVEANRSSTDGRSALCAASQSGHGAIVSLLVAHRAHGQVRLLAADAIDSLPAVLFKELPGFTAQAAALGPPRRRRSAGRHRGGARRRGRSGLTIGLVRGG